MCARPGPPPAAEPLDWMLLRSDGDGTPNTARRLARWSVEGFLLLLQSGTRLEDRRPPDLRSRQRCLACAAVPAWRVGDRGRRAREEPASAALEPLELEALHRVGEHERSLPASRAHGTPSPQLLEGGARARNSRCRDPVPGDPGGRIARRGRDWRGDQAKCMTTILVSVISSTA